MAARTKSKVTPKYKTKYRVRNWAVYEESLRRRGDITVWFDAHAVSSWRIGHIKRVIGRRADGPATPSRETTMSSAASPPLGHRPHLVPTGVGTAKHLPLLAKAARSPVSPPIPRGIHAPRGELRSHGSSWSRNPLAHHESSPEGGDIGDRQFKPPKIKRNLVPTAGGDRVGTVGTGTRAGSAPALSTPRSTTTRRSPPSRRSRFRPRRQLGPDRHPAG